MGLGVKDGFKKMVNYEEVLQFGKLEDWFEPQMEKLEEKNLKVRLYVLKPLL